MKISQKIKAFVFQGRYPYKKADLCKDDIYRPKSKAEERLRKEFALSHPECGLSNQSGFWC